MKVHEHMQRGESCCSFLVMLVCKGLCMCHVCVCCFCPKDDITLQLDTSCEQVFRRGLCRRPHRPGGLGQVVLQDASSGCSIATHVLIVCAHVVKLESARLSPTVVVQSVVVDSWQWLCSAVGDLCNVVEVSMCSLCWWRFCNSNSDSSNSSNNSNNNSIEEVYVDASPVARDEVHVNAPTALQQEQSTTVVDS
jgi:hypothetical protein